MKEREGIMHRTLAEAHIRLDVSQKPERGMGKQKERKRIDGVGCREKVGAQVEEKM